MRHKRHVGSLRPEGGDAIADVRVDFATSAAMAGLLARPLPGQPVSNELLGSGCVLPEPRVTKGIVVLLSAAWFILAPVSGTATETSLYEQANQAYFNGDYVKAAALYREMLSDNRAPAAILYNLGNAKYQLGRFGEAVYYFKRALAGASGELKDRAESNLEAARKALLARYKEKIEKGIIRYDENHGVWYSVFTLVSSTVLLALFLLFSFPLAISLFGWTFLRSASHRLVARMVFLSLLLPALVTGVFYFGRAIVESKYKLGIITTDDATFLDAPDLSAPSQPLPEGLEVRVLLHNEAGFYKIQLAGGRTGYVPDDRLLPFPDSYSP